MKLQKLNLLSLRLFHTLPALRDTLGPGLRAVVWVQGCTLGCPGCMVPETWSDRGGRTVDPDALGHELLVQEDLDGLTVSGGEPFQQPEALAQLLEVFKQAGKNTWVYSGYTLEELLSRDDPAVDTALSFTDVLVDGRYDKAQAGRYRWRGSANQRLLYLTDAIPPTSDEGETSRVEITLDATGQLLLVGIPPPGFLHRLRQALARRGARLQPRTPWK